MTARLAVTKERTVTARGLGTADLPEIYREEYLHAIELTKAQHDPATDWEGFVDSLWKALVPAFGLDVSSTQTGRGE